MTPTSLLLRAAFVIGGIVLGSNAINYYVFGNTGDYLGESDRMGSWRKAQIRPACYEALEAAKKDSLMPRKPAGDDHHIGYLDFERTREMTAALHCYVVTHADAVCEPNNRAWIFDFIGKYYGAMNDMVARAERYSKAEAETVKRLWSSPRNQSIDEAIANHIRNGRLNQADFGWTAPDAVKPLLRQSGKVTDTCPAKKAAVRGPQAS